MTEAAALPPWIAEWIRRSGVRELTGEPGSTAITDGEVVWLVNFDPDGWSMLRRSSRGSTPRVVLGAKNADVAARSVASIFGAVIRIKAGLPTIRFPVSSPDAADGFLVTRALIRNEESSVLSLTSGELLAFADDDELGVLNLVKLSHHLTMPPDELLACYLDPAGGTLARHPGVSLVPDHVPDSPPAPLGSPQP
ncbi:MAG: TNT antitoxin family protein [Nocardiaceae bacterium]|nr:TNT antitoxin family protein [Nocardiaceae bacterium]